MLKKYKFLHCLGTSIKYKSLFKRTLFLPAIEAIQSKEYHKPISVNKFSRCPVKVIQMLGLKEKRFLSTQQREPTILKYPNNKYMQFQKFYATHHLFTFRRQDAKITENPQIEKRGKKRKRSFFGRRAQNIRRK